MFTWKIWFFLNIKAVHFWQGGDWKVNWRFTFIYLKQKPFLMAHLLGHIPESESWWLPTNFSSPFQIIHNIASKVPLLLIIHNTRDFLVNTRHFTICSTICKQRKKLNLKCAYKRHWISRPMPKPKHTTLQALWELLYLNL